VISRAFELVADLISSSAKELKQDLSRHTLFAYGGNGSLFACGVAEKVGVHTVQLFALGPVFSAFGSSVSDICHVYERSLSGRSISGAGDGSMARILEEIKAEGTKDLLGEGIRPDGLTYEIELEVSGDGRNSIPVPCSESAVSNDKGLRSALATAFETSSGALAEKFSLELMRVRVKKAMSKPRLADRALKGPDCSHARIGSRKIFWGSHTGEAQLYRWESLEPGNRIEGPAVLEGLNTTYFVPEGWTMSVDRFGNGALVRK
jgi:N-methylhydantoinase A/oxoprolinase/acetone carboxylase beta subunit